MRIALLDDDSAGILLRPRQNCAASGGGGSNRPDLLLGRHVPYATFSTRLKTNFARREQRFRGRVDASALRRTSIVQCNIESAWRFTLRVLRLLNAEKYPPPIGKELPMEFTPTLTAVLAAVSFGFVAAVILGMI